MAEYDPSSRAHIRIASKEAKLRDTQDAEVLQNIMSYEVGRAWMLTKLEACHIFATTFAPNANQTAFNEGARNIGLMLLNDIMKHCPRRLRLNDEGTKCQRHNKRRKTRAE